MHYVKDTLPNIALTERQRAVLRETRIWLERFFATAKKGNNLVLGAHSIDHHQRVAGMAALLAVKEGYDPFLPVMAALILDIGRVIDDPRSRTHLHGQLSAELARDHIEAVHNLTDTDKELVLNAVEDHPLLNEHVRESYVAKILMDADRLNTIGAFAPVRAAATRWHLPLFTGDEGESPEEPDLVSIYQDFAVRIPRWYDSLWTESARRLARPRLEFLRRYIEQYQSEAWLSLRSYRELGI